MEPKQGRIAAEGGRAADHENEPWHRTIFEDAAISMALLDSQGLLLDANPACQQMLGYSRGELRGRLLTDVTHPDDVERSDTLRQELLAHTCRSCHGVLRYAHRDGRTIWANLTLTLLQSTQEPGPLLLGLLEDRTAVRQQAEPYAELPFHEGLTGLPNRTVFQERLGHALATAQHGDTTLAVLLLDLDRFREINDTFGHDYGDALLHDVSVRLAGVLRDGDTIAHLGEDEFGVVAPGADAHGAVQLADRILQCLREPFRLPGHAIPIDASLGIALCPNHGHVPSTLLRRADVAMYRAKQGERGVAVYQRDDDQHTQRRLLLRSGLRRAIEQGELRLHYQPKLDCTTGRVAGVEALVRWEHSRFGLVPPLEFVPLAEHSGLDKPLTQWVIGEALRQIQQWREVGHHLVVSVNLSARSLHDPQLATMITGALQQQQVPPSRLCLEITESSIMSEPARALQVLTHLHAMGLRISLDDFGTGYSSLAYLKRLPVSEIKIDKSFVLQILEDEHDYRLVRGTTSLAHDLGLCTVAEGIEQEGAWVKACEAGCDLGQGYWVSPPLPAAACTAWLLERGGGTLTHAYRSIPCGRQVEAGDRQIARDSDDGVLGHQTIN